MEKTFYHLNEVCQSLCIGRTKLYSEIDAGKLKLTKLGRRSLVHKADLEAYIASLTGEQHAAA